jgi:hypothetical protein
MPLSSLGPGKPDPAARPSLEALDDAAFGGRIADRDMAACCRAALWLAFDHLDESHAISQDVGTVEGSYWHGILHRREPDHANAAYWFRRVGTHPVFTELARRAAELGYPGAGTAWDPFAFNDACEEHRGKGGPVEETLRRVQRAEWELLFAWCYRHAAGA